MHAPQTAAARRGLLVLRFAGSRILVACEAFRDRETPKPNATQHRISTLGRVVKPVSGPLSLPPTSSSPPSPRVTSFPFACNGDLSSPRALIARHSSLALISLLLPPRLLHRTLELSARPQTSPVPSCSLGQKVSVTSSQVLADLPDQTLHYLAVDHAPPNIPSTSPLR